MIALFIISFALLAATAYTLYRRRHASSDYPAQLGTRDLSPRSLFDGPETHTDERRLLAARESREAGERLRTSFLNRAAEGDSTTLAEARRVNDDTLYAAVLDGLLDWAADSEANLSALASFVAADTNLRGSRRLAVNFKSLWREHPDRRRTAQMLHLAALSDDAGTFESAVVAAFEAHRAGRLEEIRFDELSALVESEYWVLGSEARRAGAGFALKERLAALRVRPPAGAEARPEQLDD